MPPYNSMNDFYLRQAQPYQQTFNFPPHQPQIRASQLANESVTYEMAMIVGDDTRVFDKEYHGEVAE